MACKQKDAKDIFLEKHEMLKRFADDLFVISFTIIQVITIMKFSCNKIRTVLVALQ